MKLIKIGMVAAFMALCGFSMVSPTQAQSLRKLGKAIEYPIRKAGENISGAVHQTVGDKSIRKDRHTGQKYVVTPAGTKIPLHHHHYRHHRLHKK